MKIKYLILVLVLLFAAAAGADYFNPPNWQNCLGYTHQSWDFNTGQFPLIADGDPNWKNHFGEPNFIAVDYNVPPQWQHLIPYGLVGWEEEAVYGSLDSDRRGYYGGMGDTTLTFEIPGGQPKQYYKKLLWVQMTYFARKDGEKTFDMKISSNEDFSDTNNACILDCNIVELNEPIGELGRWYRATRIYKITSDSNNQYVKLTAYRLPVDENIQDDMGGPCMIDQVDIDCRTVNIADIDYDYVVDMIDFVAFAAQWQYSGEGLSADLDNDSFVGFLDLAMFAEQWQYKWERSIADLNTDDVVNIIDFAHFANQWQNSGQNLEADFDGSLIVDTNDLSVVINSWLDGF